MAGVRRTAAAVLHILLVLLVAAAAGALAGCGGSAGEPRESGAPRDSGTAAGKQAGKGRNGSSPPQFTCAAQATEKPKPDRFPPGFPLPQGTVVIGSEERSDGRVILYGVSPHDVKATLAELQQISDAGFRLTEGEVEERDAESDWVGNGYRGRWAIRQIPGCPDETSVTVLAQRQ